MLGIERNVQLDRGVFSVLVSTCTNRFALCLLIIKVECWPGWQALYSVLCAL